MRVGTRSARALARLTVVVASVLVAIGLCELGARLAEGPRPPVAATPDQYEFYRFDDVLGWSQAPGTRGTFQRAEFTHPVSVNDHGMRYRAVSKRRTPGVARIAVLGDSFTWGLGVRVEDRLTERAEALLGGRAELLNFGVSGYAPVQYDLMLDEVLSFEPQIVVVVFCLANDFLDNVLWRRYGYYKPYAVLDGPDGVAMKGYPLPNVGDFAGRPRRDGALQRWLAGHSSLYRRLEPLGARARSAGAEPAQEGLTGIDEWEREIYADPATLGPAASTEVAAAVEINRRLLRDIAARAAAAGARLAILPAPTKCELGRCFGDPEARPNLRALEQLKRTAEAIGVPVLDTGHTLDLADFWDQDSHWRPSGHEKMAVVLARWLEATLPGR